MTKDEWCKIFNGKKIKKTLASSGDIKLAFVVVENSDKAKTLELTLSIDGENTKYILPLREDLSLNIVH